LFALYQKKGKESIWGSGLRDCFGSDGVGGEGTSEGKNGVHNVQKQPPWSFVDRGSASKRRENKEKVEQNLSGGKHRRGQMGRRDPLSFCQITTQRERKYLKLRGVRKWLCDPGRFHRAKPSNLKTSKGLIVIIQEETKFMWAKCWELG